MDTNTLTPSPPLKKIPIRGGMLEKLKLYFTLTKPRIIVLLTITGIVGYMLPAVIEKSPMDVNYFIKLLIAIFMGYAAAGGAMAVNNYLDRDIDILMTRTATRPSVSENGIKPAEKILVFGFTLILISLLIAYFVFNFLTALMLFLAVIAYLTAYSLLLKRKIVWSTVISAPIGSIPTWVGYTAILGYIPFEGWLLGLLVAFWTPSHTWSMASKNINDYAKANIPMFPVVYGLKRTAQVNLALILFFILYSAGLAYLITKTLLVIPALIIPDLLILYTSIVFLKNPTPKNGKLSFIGHNFWLALTFFIILIFAWFF